MGRERERSSTKGGRESEGEGARGREGGKGHGVIGEGRVREQSLTAIFFSFFFFRSFLLLTFFFPANDETEIKGEIQTLGGNVSG